MLLAILVVGGAALRCATLPYLSFHGDEAYTLRWSDMSASWILSHYTTGLTMHGYILLMKAWGEWLGRSELAFKLPSLLAGIAAIPLLFLLVRRLVDERTALVAALLAAIDPSLVVTSRFARVYALLVVVAIVSMWSAHRAWRSGERSAFVVLGVLDALAVAGTLNAAYLVVTQGAWFVVESVLETRVRRRALLSGFFLSGVITVGLALAFYWAALPEMREFVEKGVGSSRSWAETLSGGLSALHPGASLLLLGVAIAGAWRLGRAGAGGRLILLWAVVPCLVYLATNPRFPTWAVGRYLLASLPAHLVLLAAGWCALAEGVARALLLLRARDRSRLRAAPRTALAPALALMLATAFVAWTWVEQPSRFAGLFSEGRPTVPAVAALGRLAEPRDLVATERAHERWILDGRVPCPVLSLSDLLERGEPVSSGRLFVLADRDAAAEREWTRRFRLHPVRGEGWREEAVLLESGSLERPGTGAETVRVLVEGMIAAAEQAPVKVAYRHHQRLAGLLEALAALEAGSGLPGRAARHREEARRHRALAKRHAKEAV